MSVVKQPSKHHVSSNSTFSIEELDNIYHSVFRQSTDQPGFYYQDFGDQMDSKTFRRIMVELKNELSNISGIRSNKKLNYHWIGRFDHQHSSRFHRDSAAAHSFLILGYEPTKVDSRVSLADYTKHMESQSMSLKSYFGENEDINTIDNDELLAPYTTELTPFPKNHYRLILLNNSKSFEEPTFGVFHRGEVTQKIDGEDRIINSMMLHLCDKSVDELHDTQDVLNFVNTNKIDR